MQNSNARKKEDESRAEPGDNQTQNESDQIRSKRKVRQASRRIGNESKNRGLIVKRGKRERERGREKERERERETGIDNARKMRRKRKR